MIDYQGVVDNELLVKELKMKRPDLIIVKDLVQAPFHLNETSLADYQFTSFRKAFPVPDGSWVITKHPMIQPVSPSRFSEYKLAASLLKRNRSLGYYNDKVYLELYERGEQMIDKDIVDYDMSDYSRAYLEVLNWNRIAEIRKRNAAQIIEGVASLGINTIGYALMYPKYTTLALSFAMLPFKIISLVVNALLAVLLMNVLVKILPKDKFCFIEEKHIEN